VSVRLAESDDEILACLPVLLQLRPHLDAETFVERVRRQQSQGYRLACVRDDERVTAVAGFRIHDSLAWGRHMYVDDLVTADDVRSRGYGQELFDWLVEFARGHGCDALHLDSGVQRFGAHRFYLRNRMQISSHHFGLDLRE
jgi:GNAT superfamily N-acetyltransferase